jgi:hypothetical protein
VNKPPYLRHAAARRRFRYLKRRLRSSSSSYSIRSDFPIPLHGTERRLLSRGSADIYPSSGEETPVFTTPTDRTPLVTPNDIDNNVKVAMSILDSCVRESSTEGADLGLMRNTSTIPTTGGSDELDSASKAPADTPSLSGIAATHTSPNDPGHRGRAAMRSRLSEVTTPEDLITADDPLGACGISDTDRPGVSATATVLEESCNLCPWSILDPPESDGSCKSFNLIEHRKMKSNFSSTVRQNETCS